MDEGLVLERVRPGSKIKSGTETIATHLQVGYVGEDNDGGDDNDELLMGDLEPPGDRHNRKTGTSSRLQACLRVLTRSLWSGFDNLAIERLCYDVPSVRLCENDQNTTKKTQANDLSSRIRPEGGCSGIK